MTEEKLHQLFHELNHEVTEVQISDITEWVKKTQSPSFQFKLTSSVIGVTIILVAIFSFYGINQKNSVIQRTKTTSLKPSENFGELKPRKSNENTILKDQIPHELKAKNVVAIPVEPFEIFNFGKLPLKTLTNVQATIQTEKNVSKNWMMEIFKIQNKQAVVFDSVIPKQNSLYILDSLQTYRSNRKLAMDEKDCYLQVLNDYAVISYRFRGATVFKSGKIYETGLMEFEGKKIRVFGFVCDNRYSPANFGQRNFFGIVETDLESKEIILFGFNWNPVSIIRSHSASQLERDALIKRSNQQQNL